MEKELDVIVVGGGLAGLNCARLLHQDGLKCQVLEAADNVGGRVRTDEVDGFLLDRGFQVFLTAYPEARAALDYDELNLRRFEPGALIWSGGKFHRLSDPWRRPQHALATAMSPVAKLSDKLRIAGFRRHTTRCELSELYERPERPTIELLRQRGFSNLILERFFRPFLGGVFLDPDLETSSRMCEFVFRMFSLGDAAVPERGMAEIPRQLAGQLPPEVVRTKTRVANIDQQDVVLSTGDRLTARAIVVATEEGVAHQLLGDSRPTSGRSVTCLYFAAAKPPIDEPILILNGEGSGPVNNVCVPSQVSASYAPRGQSLISVTVLQADVDPETLLPQVCAQMTNWFGAEVESWRHLKTYAIPYALPKQSPPALDPVEKSCLVRDGRFVCGDHCDVGSINGAMSSGRRAAEAVMSALVTG